MLLISGNLRFLSPPQDLSTGSRGSTRRERSFFLGPGCSTFADHGRSFNLQRSKNLLRGSSKQGEREKYMKMGEKKIEEWNKEVGEVFLVMGVLVPPLPEIFITAERSYCLPKPRSSATIIGTKLFAFLLRLPGISEARPNSRWYTFRLVELGSYWARFSIYKRIY